MPLVTLVNDGPLGDLHYGQDQRFVRAGETVEVPDSEVAGMLASGQFSKAKVAKAKADDKTPTS